MFKQLFIQIKQNPWKIPVKVFFLSCRLQASRFTKINSFACFQNSTKMTTLCLRECLIKVQLGKVLLVMPVMNVRKSGQLPPEENCPPVSVGVLVKVRVSFRVGGNQTIAPEKNWPLVRVSFWVGGTMKGTNFKIHFSFKNAELKKQWIRFDKRKDCLATKHLVLCELHFEKKYLRSGEKCHYSDWWILHPLFIPKTF